PKHYIGFEISGLIHVGTLFASGAVINHLLSAGAECTVFLADWHSVINNKLGGDWEKINAASKYYEEAFKFHCPGVKIVRGTELYDSKKDYWKDVIRFSKNFSLERATRCLQIMGREENEKLELAQYFYPSMQAVDIHALDVDIAHAGMDQRKAHMLAREVFPKMGWKPFVSLHHSLLPSLSGKDLKMSKSIPSSAIFIHDSEALVKEKIAKAFCPETADENPVLAFAKTFARFPLTIERPEKYGGSVSFDSYASLEHAFLDKKLHAGDLKAGVAIEMNALISPVRKHFETHKKLLEVFDSVKISR
ncbi:MAG: tyrosine--tRNA ligase, partial [Candidatus Micrarchaeota archaeon]